jgi:hypothetical protein
MDVVASRYVIYYSWDRSPSLSLRPYFLKLSMAEAKVCRKCSTGASEEAILVTCGQCKRTWHHCEYESQWKTKLHTVRCQLRYILTQVVACLEPPIRLDELVEIMRKRQQNPDVWSCRRCQTRSQARSGAAQPASPNTAIGAQPSTLKAESPGLRFTPLRYTSATAYSTYCAYSSPEARHGGA